MAVVAGEEEDDDEQDEQEQVLFVVVESAVLPLPLPDALGVALSGKTKGEDDEDMARGATAACNVSCFNLIQANTK